MLSESLFPLKNKSMNGDNMTRYSIIHKDGSETGVMFGAIKLKANGIKETTIMEAIYSNGNQNTNVLKHC